ncbi:MAG: hypothetical protein RDU25_01495 [Patescibacteria group bacterium]|nr:hypothetical protein [Patescibacteria group bacterium]
MQTTKQDKAAEIIVQSLTIVDISSYIKQEGVTADKIVAASFRGDDRLDLYTSHGFDIDTKGQIVRPNFFGVNLLSLVRAKDGSLFFETSDDDQIPPIASALHHFVQISDRNGQVAHDLFFVGFTRKTHQYVITPSGKVIKLNANLQRGVTHVRYDRTHERLYAVLHFGDEASVGTLDWLDCRDVGMKRLADPGFWEKIWSDKTVASISRPRNSRMSTNLVVNFTDQTARVLTFNPVQQDVSPVWGKLFASPDIQIGHMLGTDLMVDFLPQDDALTFNVRDFTRQDHPLASYFQ